MADPKKIIKGATSVGKKLLAEPAPAYTSKILESTTAKFADKIADANPKLTDAEVQKKALAQATKKLEWERVQKPALEKRYGPLAKASFAESNPNKMQNTAEVVAERKRKANEFLDQPTEPWTPPRPELQAFDRSSIKDALEGFPDVQQSSFPRDKPARASTSHVEELYNDPENRALIEKQIKRGLPLGGETFYASLYPVKQAVMEAGMPAEKFDKWIHSLAPASARNSIMNEMAVGQFLRNMNARGIPLTEENVAKEMALYKEKFGIGLPLMPIHRQGVQNVLEGGVNLREQNLANVPTNYKIPTYGTQKAGDFANSAVLDVHEAGGHTQGSRFHPYFNEAGGFGNTEYGKGEEGLLGIANELGIPGGMAQAGRWFGGGELTGLKSPRGDALDLLEKQVAFTLQQKGIQPNPANVRKEVLKQIETGEGDLLPWYRKEGMPDVRETGLQRAEGGTVDIEAADRRLAAAIEKRMAQGGGVDIEAADARLAKAIEARMNMADGGEVGFKKIQFMDKGGKVGKVASGLSKISKRLLADSDVLPTAEREANLAKFLSTSQEKRRLYHATPADFKEFQGKGFDPTISGNATWLTANKEKQPAAHNVSSRTEVYREGANVMPVHIQAERPMVLDNEVMEDWARAAYANGSPEFPFLLAPEWLKKVKEDGYDSIFHPRSGEIIMLEPNKIKSAIGNRGTYDISDPDITKAEGGGAFKKLQFMADGGGAFKKLQWQEPQHFDGGGMAVDLSDSEPLFTKKELETMKRNAPEVYEWAKQNVKDEASQLKSAKGAKDFALRVGAQYAGALPDLANLLLMVPDAIAGTKLSSEKPWFGSEQYIDAMHKAGMLGENEFPISETVAGILAPAGLIKKGGKKAYQAFENWTPKAPKKRRGGLAAMSR